MPLNTRRPPWRDLAALVLALGLVAAVVILAVSELDHGASGHISETESTLFATVLGALVGAVATYLGMRDNGQE